MKTVLSKWLRWPKANRFLSIAAAALIVALLIIVVLPGLKNNNGATEPDKAALVSPSAQSRANSGQTTSVPMILPSGTPSPAKQAVHTQPVQSPVPQKTPGTAGPKPSPTASAGKVVNGEWSAWSGWMTLEEMEKERASEYYHDKKTEFERAMKVRTIIGDMHYKWRYKELSVNWQGWIDNTENLDSAQILQRYGIDDYRVEFSYEGDIVQQYRYGTISYTSDWSAWQPEPIEQRYHDSNRYLTQFEKDYDKCEWTDWRIVDENTMTGAEEEGYYVFRLRWQYSF